MNIVEKIKPLQTPNRANAFLLDAIENIDSALGAGYAAKHPELIAAYLNLSAAGSDNSALVRCFDEVNETLKKIYGRFDDFAERSY